MYVYIHVYIHINMYIYIYKKYYISHDLILNLINIYFLKKLQMYNISTHNDQPMECCLKVANVNFLGSYVL